MWVWKYVEIVRITTDANTKHENWLGSNEI